MTKIHMFYVQPMRRITLKLGDESDEGTSTKNGISRAA